MDYCLMQTSLAYCKCTWFTQITVTVLPYLLKVLGYVKLAVNEGGEIVYGEGKEPPLELPSPHTEVKRFSYLKL